MTFNFTVVVLVASSLWALLLGVTRVAAQSLSETPLPAAAPALPDEAIVVTARRSEEPLGQAPVAVEVISRQRIAISGARDAAQALQNQPGVQIDSGFQGQALRLSGLDPKHTLILVDGERIAGALDGALDLSRFLGPEIERIEIVRGPASAVYGSDAMAGVVNIITRVPREALMLEAQGSAGFTRGPDGSVFDLGRHGDAFATLAGGVRKLRARATLGYRKESAYDLTPSTLSTTGSALDAYLASTKVDYLPSARVRIPFMLRAQRRDQKGIDESGSNAVYDRTTRADELSVQLAPRIKLRSDDTLITTGGYTVVRRQYLRDQRGDDDGDTFEDSREHMATLRGQYDARLGSQLLLTGGVEALGQYFSSPRLSKTGERARISPYVQAEWTVSDAPRVRTVLVPSARVDIDSQYGTNVSPRLAARVDPLRGLALRASVGRGFRAPSFTELLLSFDNPSANYRVRGNPDLEPENSLGANLGAEFTAVDWYAATLNLFHNEVRDLIDTRLTQIIAGESQYEYINVARARSQGVEASWLVHPISVLNVDFSYTLTRARDLDRDRQLPGRALHRGSVQVALAGQGQPLSLSVRAVISGESQYYLDDDSDPSLSQAVRVKRHVTGDARLAYRIGKYVEPFVRGENLSNVGGSNLPIRPLTVFLGLTVNN
jgi:outer membrane receptor for ferrienterochelin and colicins